MIKKLAILLAVAILLIMSSFPVFAGGDQVRGDDAVGPANQHQVVPPPPFEP